MEQALLFFDKDHPYWNTELLIMAGANPGDLKELLESESLEVTQVGNLRLTLKGKGELQKYGQENYIPLELPSYDDVKEDRAIQTTRFYLLFEKACQGRWSWKDYFFRRALEYFPCLPMDEIYRIQGDQLQWLYLDNPMVQAFLTEYPHTGLNARNYPSPDLEKAEKWMEEQGLARNTFTPDMLFLSHYDFEYYSDVLPDPNDRYGFLNADRMFCFISPGPVEKNLPLFMENIAAVHLLLLNYRYLYLPGYTNLDTANQENLNWLVWVTQTEGEAHKLKDLLGRFGKELIRPALPLDIMVFSHESLASVREKTETIYDLIFYYGHPIARPD